MTYLNLKRFMLIALFGFCSALTTWAQVETGTPPFESFGGGPFDVINLGNLNVHFGVNIVAKPGRGLPFTYTLAYDSSVFNPAPVNGVQTWLPVTNWGWVGQTQAATGYISYFTAAAKCAVYHYPNPTVTWVNYT